MMKKNITGGCAEVEKKDPRHPPKIRIFYQVDVMRIPDQEIIVQQTEQADKYQHDRIGQLVIRSNSVLPDLITVKC
jgi:hypothetical protein